MKKHSWIILFLLLALINFFGEGKNSPGEKINQNKKSYSGGLAVSELKNYKKTADYFIVAELNAEEKILTVKEKIIWHNKTGSQAEQLQFNFFANAFQSSNTTYAKGKFIPKKNQTRIDLKEFLINGEKSELIFFAPDDGNENDSTAAKAYLNVPVNPGDSVIINFSYSLKIPLLSRRFGYSKDFYLVAQWFPKLTVFEHGRWITHQYHFNTEFFSDFADYYINIKVPNEFSVAASGILKSESEDKKFTNYSFVQKAVHDFAWTAAKNYTKQTEVFKSSNKKEVEVEIYYREGDESYIRRYFEAVFNSLKFMEERVGDYPYQKITLIDTPLLNFSAGMEYPTMITINSDLISPKETLYPEKLVVHEFLHQYFYAIIANNETAEAWLDEGLASFFTNKIINKYYGPGVINFRLVNYLPVYGLSILSYNEIPIIYFLGKFDLPEKAESMRNYYRNLTIGSIADSSYQLPNYLSYTVNSYYKPKLMLLSLEKYIGEEKFYKILKKYFEEFKFGHPIGKDLIAVIQNNTEEDLSWFFKNVYESSFVFDYKVSIVNRIQPDEYEIILERLGDGVFYTDIAVYTESDTMMFEWRDDSKWKSLKVKTDNEITAVVIDPERKNLLDINFANNSYTAARQIAAPLSLSIRWLFWIQNALMMLGSIG